VPAGSARTRNLTSAAPADGDLLLSDLGLVRRATVIAGLRVSGRVPEAVLSGRATGAGPGVAVRAVSAGGGVLAVARTGPRGAFRLRVRSSGRVAVEIVRGRGVLGARAAVMVPAPPRARSARGQAAR
jgi:hypothetical protein